MSDTELRERMERRAGLTAKKNGAADITWQLPKSSDPEREGKCDRITMAALYQWIGEMVQSSLPTYLDNIEVDDSSITIHLTSSRER
jgi:hypothetical protein